MRLVKWSSRFPSDLPWLRICSPKVNVVERFVFLRWRTLSREIDTAQEPTQMARQGNQADCEWFNSQAVPWQVH